MLEKLVYRWPGGLSTIQTQFDEGFRIIGNSSPLLVGKLDILVDDVVVDLLNLAGIEGRPA